MADGHYQAVFVDTATTPASVLRVKIPGFDNGVGTFVVTWSPLGNALPAAGDQALVVEADDGTWWAVAWESAAQGATDLATQAELDAAVNGKKIRSGTGTVTWAGGSPFSATTTVTHGLGATPTAVIATCIAGSVSVGAYQALNFTPTTFDVKAEYASGATTAGSQTFSWIAST